MTVLHLADQKPFTTKDGSTIRSILDRTNAPVEKQSLAEARVPAGTATQRHYHRLAEEFYFVLEGAGEMEIGGETCTVGPGDAILIPAGAWHTITARETTFMSAVRARRCSTGSSRRSGGKFVLRIEDTDEARNTRSAAGDLRRHAVAGSRLGRRPGGRR